MQMFQEKRCAEQLRELKSLLDGENGTQDKSDSEKNFDH